MGLIKRLRPTRGLRHSSCRSVAEVVELQRHAQLFATQQGNRLLQIVALLAGDAYLLALNGGLHLELGVFDHGDDFLRQVFIDALPQNHFLLHFFA